MGASASVSDEDTALRKNAESKEDADEAQRQLQENSALPELFHGHESLSYQQFLKGRQTLTLTLALTLTLTLTLTLNTLHGQAFALDATPLTEKIFHVLDDEQAGRLVENDLLQTLDRYRRLPYNDKLRWCFKVYDLDGNGVIDRDELNALLMDVNYSVRTHKSTTSTAQKLSKVYERRHHKAMDKVSEEEFVEMAQQNPNLLIYPALGTMERILNASFHDPDDHLEKMWCCCLGF